MNDNEKLLNEFKESLANLSVKELKELELEIIKEGDEMNDEAAKKTFTLKDEDGKPLSSPRRGSMGNLIAGFVARTESSWREALVIKSIIDFWKSKNNEVPFPILDTTLRLLGQIKYSGIAEIDNVVAVNQMFENIREEFMKFSERMFFIAGKHQEVVNALKLEEPDTEGGED